MRGVVIGDRRRESPTAAGEAFDRVLALTGGVVGGRIENPRAAMVRPFELTLYIVECGCVS